MANPRKFSEKIALHNQKQAEETAAFEQIMKEVSDATMKVPMNNMEESKPMRDRGVGPMRTRPNEKSRIDTSPYGSASYLSPPSDTSWRRTNSDSALHQSSMNISVDHNINAQRRVGDAPLLGIVVPDPNDPSRKQFVASIDGRPRSSCDIPRIPGINIYPSQPEPGTIQIPIGSNTGSLPDLTHFHIPPPLSTPLDQEDPNSSPYSTSPQAASPATLSPTNPSSRHMGKFPFTGSPQDSQGPSPRHSPRSQERHCTQTHLQNLIIGGPQSPPHNVNHLSVPSLMNSSYLHTCKGVTLDGTNSQMDQLQHNHYIYQQQQQQKQQQRSPHPSQSSPPSPQQQNHNQNQQQPSPLSPQNLPPHLSYRTPQRNRPSPETSPGLNVQAQNIIYRSGSPGDTSHSGPQSPVSPASSPGLGPNSGPFFDNSYFTPAQALALQQTFEQFSMIDNPVPQTSISSPNYTTHFTQAVNAGNLEDGLGSQELSTDPGYYSQSPLQQYSRPINMNPSGGSTQQTTPQTPNTPSSIPDLIITDFSSNPGDELSRQAFAKDLGSAMSGSFDADIFPSDETLREGLGPIDLDDFQMLADPEMNLIKDPSTEDNFRLDRL